MTARQYTKFNQDELLSYAEKILKSKNGKISEFGSSGYGRTMLELFTAFTESESYRTELAWREGWLSESTQLSSKFIGARDLGYSVRRNVPARSVMNVSIKRSGEKADVKVIVPKNTQFEVNGKTMIALDDMEFLYGRNLQGFEDGVMQLVSGRAILAEGKFVTEEFYSNDSKNQEFFIFDPNFSNWFGDSDPNYTELGDMGDRVSMFTTISSDAGLVDNYTPVKGHEDQILWRVSRRGLFDPLVEDSINDVDNFNPNGNLSNNFTSLVETSNDGNIRISFGDGVNAAIPYGKVTVRYFQTEGANGNLSNIAGNEITTASSNIKIVQSNGQESDLTLDDLTFSLITDVIGGINTEDGESITKNAPKIYSNLDRLGNEESYEVFLSREFNIKYANAYGEDILSRYNRNSKADFKYANTVRYSILRELYKEIDGNYFTSDAFEYFVEGYKVNGLMYAWEYDYAELPNQNDINKLEIDYDAINDNIDYGNLVIRQPVTQNAEQPTANAFEVEDLSTYLAKVSFSAPHSIKVDDYINISGASLEINGEYIVRQVESDAVYVDYQCSISIATDYNVSITSTIIDNSEFFQNYINTTIPTSLVPSTLFSADLQAEDFIVDGSELDIINRKLSKRSQLTLKKRHLYQPPIVHLYSMSIELIVSSGNSFTEIKSKVINDIYAYLKSNTGFAKPIYRSRIESIIMDYPEVLGVNLTFIPKENGYEQVDLTKNTWLSEETGQLINQNALSIDGMEINLGYTYNRELVDGTTEAVTDRTIRVTVPSQYELRSLIDNYYKSTFAYLDTNGTYKLKTTGVNEEQLNKFVAYIWTTAMNDVYNNLFSQYKDAKSLGKTDLANEIYGVIEAIRGWDTDGNIISFKDTVLITSMTEDSSKTFYNYINYILEYIKLVRKVFESKTSMKLIDKDNNITNYMLENEIPQFQISTSDIAIKLGK
jgi:hypothetical protein